MLGGDRTRYVWLTNAVAPDRAGRRFLLLGGMGAYLVLALAIPEAFEGSGLTFGLAYAAVILVHSGLFSRATDRAPVAVSPSTCWSSPSWWRAAPLVGVLPRRRRARRGGAHRRARERRPLLAIDAFGYAHYLILLGIVAIAAALKKATGNAFDPLALDAALGLAGGQAAS